VRQTQGDVSFWIDHQAKGDEEEAQRFNALCADQIPDIASTLGIGEVVEVEDYGSWENRVFRCALSDGQSVVIKFYRAARWSREAIEDEVRFIRDLNAAGVPVVKAIPWPSGAWVVTWRGIHAALFATVEGEREVMEDRSQLSIEDVRTLGRLTARIHEVGATRAAHHRPLTSLSQAAAGNLEVIGSLATLPTDARASMEASIARMAMWEATWMPEGPVIRVHGDLAINNILWTEQGPLIMDFDDMEVGLAAIDFAMLDFGYDVEGMSRPLRLTHDATQAEVDAHHAARAAIRALLLEGYREVRAFDEDTLTLIEPWLTLRGALSISPEIRAGVGERGDVLSGAGLMALS